MGQEQSIPMSQMPQKPRFWPRAQSRSEHNTRALIWQPANDVQIRLEANVALCFGDITRTLHLLQADDAELDPVGGGDSGLQQPQPQWRHLLPDLHVRPRYEDGLFVRVPDHPPAALQQQPVLIYGGRQLERTRQICDDSCLQADSRIHVLMPPHATQWRALPRPRSCRLEASRGAGDLRAAEDAAWVLPAVWYDKGMADVVDNMDHLQLSGRSRFIRESMKRINAMEGMQVICSVDELRSALGDAPLEDKKGKKRERSSWAHKLGQLWSKRPVVTDSHSVAASAEAEQACTSDSIYNPPVEFFVALRSPDDATIYPDLTLVVHVQLPPLYPLARERCRLMTPILHPLVAPAFETADTSSRQRGGLSLTGGRMAFSRPPQPNTATPPIDVLLAQFRATLRDPVECARALAAEHPDDALQHDVPLWLETGPEMELRARAMALGGLRWEPLLHAACPSAFKIEVRTLMLARLRSQEALLGSLPLEVVWLVIDHLLAVHLASGSGSCLHLYPEHYERTYSPDHAQQASF